MKRTIVAGILPAIALSVHAKPQDAVSLLAALVVHDAVVDNSSPFPYDPGFPIEKVAQLAFSLPTHSWEYGTSAQASIELYNRDASVFGANPFPEVHDVSALRSFNALVYAADKITLGKGVDGLSEGNGAVGDPASLGVAAILIGKDQKAYADAASKSVNYMLTRAPRMPNGAISHRANVAEVWADFVYMAPPTIAYYGADTKNATILQEAVRQCGLYREILQADLPTTSPLKGLWRHIIGPQSKDTGLWATGNAWAAGGMSRVLATVLKAPVARDAEWKSQAVTDLTQYIKEILDGARGAPLDNGLLRNYLDNTSGDGHGFGEIAGSTMLAATAYRMAVIDPKTFGAEYIQWADTIRVKMGGKDASGNPYITSNGTATPAVNPLAWLDKKPFTSGSPEGQAFVLLMYTAWRDCINAGICSKSSTTAPTRRSHNFSKRRLHNHH